MRRIGRYALLILWVGALMAPARVYGQNSPAIAVLSAPVPGAQLFGPVNITGSALHPAAFDHYTLEYDLLSEVGEQWHLIQEPVAQQVHEGVLATWDTASIPDGVYQLRLRVYLDDGSFAETSVVNLRVQNSPPAPVPTSAPAEAVPVTPGPSPTSPVVQPPSSNPPPQDVGEPARRAAGASRAGADLGVAQPDTARVDVGRIGRAFCTGGVLSLAAYGAFLVYRAARRFARGGP